MINSGEIPDLPRSRIRYERKVGSGEPQKGQEPLRFSEASQSNRRLSLPPAECIAFRQVILRRRCFFEYALSPGDVRLALRVTLRAARRQH